MISVRTIFIASLVALISFFIIFGLIWFFTFGNPRPSPPPSPPPSPRPIPIGPPPPTGNFKIVGTNGNDSGSAVMYSFDEPSICGSTGCFVFFSSVPNSNENTDVEFAYNSNEKTLSIFPVGNTPVCMCLTSGGGTGPFISSTCCTAEVGNVLVPGGPGFAAITAAAVNPVYISGTWCYENGACLVGATDPTALSNPVFSTEAPPSGATTSWSNVDI